MLDLLYTSRFKKDVKLMKKRGKDMKKLESIVTLLAFEQEIPAKYRDHALLGNYAEHRECHIEPDWLLIYKLPDGALRLERTGTHSDLF